MTNQQSLSIQVHLGNDIINIPQKTNKVKSYFTNQSNVTNITDKHGNFILQSSGFHYSIYNNILDNTPQTFTFNMLMDALIVGIYYFESMVISVKMNDRIVAWVKSLGKYSYTWTELLDKPNYGLELYGKRFWPYFNVDSKEWKDIATTVLRDGEYPNQSDVATTDPKSERNEISRDYKIEYGISQKYNNFLGYSVLDPNKYPNMSKIINKLKGLNKIGMHLLMFEAILRLLISPSACHIIKETELWDLVNPLFEEDKKYKDIFIHFMYYAIFILNHEDTVMFSQIRRNYRIIFTHLQAIKMPQTNTYHIEMDPYIQQLTGEIYLFQSLPYYIRCKRYIHTVNTFERRFYLATGGALTNIPLSKYNAAVSGSILIPCLSYSELEDDFKHVRFNTKRIIKNQTKFNDDLYSPVGSHKLNETDKDFMSYLEYLYPSYHSLSDAEYMKTVLTQSEPVSINSNKEDDEKSEKEVKLKYNLLSDIDISITIDNYDTFEEIALIIGNQIQQNCKHIGDVWIQKVHTVSSFKYKIYGPGLIRPIDLFRVPYGPCKMVKKFHCPIVRSWYDGANDVVDDTYNHANRINKYWDDKTKDYDTDEYTVDQVGEDNVIDDDTISSNDINASSTDQFYIGVNMIDSSVFTTMSGINNNYKWFFNSKPCVEVILKYAQRGFTTICNKKEITALHEYMKNSPRWKYFIGNDIDMCGSVGKNHIFFNPCHVNAGIRYKLRQFKKPQITTYSKKLYVGAVNGKTEYDVNLNIKDNTRVYMPQTNKINSFNEYMTHTYDDEFSDGDDSV
jgi:hypothetical protein